MSDDIDKADEATRQLFHKWKNEEAPRTMLREVAEQQACEMWGVKYDRDGGHRQQLRDIADDVKVWREQHRLRQQRAQGTMKLIWEKAVTLLTGMAIAFGFGWAAKRLGVTLPGAGP